MKVSRDVETKFIVDIPIEERFFKLPVENFLNVINVTPTEPQIAIINAINDLDLHALLLVFLDVMVNLLCVIMY